MNSSQRICWSMCAASLEIQALREKQAEIDREIARLQAQSSRFADEWEQGDYTLKALQNEPLPTRCKVALESMALGYYYRQYTDPLTRKTHFRFYSTTTHREAYMLFTLTEADNWYLLKRQFVGYVLDEKDRAYDGQIITPEGLAKIKR